MQVHGSKPQLEAVRKVNRMINSIRDDQSVCIYGSGEHTAQLLRYTAVLQKKVRHAVVEGDLAGCSLAGVKLGSLDETMANPPDIIVISSYERQEEMAELLKTGHSYAGEILVLYDKATDDQPFYADVFRLQNPALAHASFNKYVRDLNEYVRLSRDAATDYDFHPRLGDDIPVTPIDYVYLFQDTWCAGKIFTDQPDFHVDIGSTALLVGILSQFTSVCSVDIRPLPIQLNGLECRNGSIVQLPFADRELKSVSSLCVVEHVGLGRYGDEIDPLGREKAIRELCRVLAPGGNLYVSVPIGKPCVVYNAHETFDFGRFLSLFSDLQLVEVKFVYGEDLISLEEWELIYLPHEESVGLFHFRREGS